MQETKETLPEWIDREAQASLNRYLSCDSASSLACMRRVIAPYIEAVDAAQRRSRELEDTVVTQRSRIDKLEKDNAAGEYRVDELEKDLAEQRDHSRKLEAELAAMRDVERTEHDATWAANEMARVHARFLDARHIDSSSHGEVVALPFAVTPLIALVTSTNTDRNRLRAENLQLARDASAAREREERAVQGLVECEDRLRDCYRELARQNANVERLASDAGKFSHKWTALVNERDHACGEVLRLTEDARVRRFTHDVAMMNANDSAKHFEQDAMRLRAEVDRLTEESKRRAEQAANASAKWLAATDELIDERKKNEKLRANVERLVARVKTFDEKWAQQASELHTERAEHANAREKLTLYEAEIHLWISRHNGEALKLAAAETAIRAAECATLDERKAHVATKARLDAADFNKGVCGKRFDDERVAHENTKAELAQEREKLGCLRVDYDAECAAHAVTKCERDGVQGVCDDVLEELRQQRERADDYLATVNGLLRRERERAEVQS